MAQKKKNVSPELLIIITIILAFFELASKYMMKYSVNNLSILDFSLFNFGNILNFLTTLSLSASVITLLFVTKTIRTNLIKRIMLFILTAIMVNFIIMFVKLFNIQLPGLYIGYYSVHKIVIGIFYVINQFLLLYTAFYILIILRGKRKYTSLTAALNTCYTFILLLLIAFIYTTFFTNSEKLNADDEKYESAIVLGAAVWKKIEPSPIFRGRILKAKELLDSNRVASIQLTGGAAPGEIAEAEAAYNYLLSLGVKDRYLNIESRTSTTSEQIKYLKEHIQRKIGNGNIIIISDRFHLRRVLAMCSFFNVDAKVAPSDYDLGWQRELLYTMRESVALSLFWLFAI